MAGEPAKLESFLNLELLATPRARTRGSGLAAAIFNGLDLASSLAVGGLRSGGT